MFDITAGVDVTITGFDCNMGETVTPYNMEIYYKAGTHVGFTTTPGAWTLAGSANNIVGLGANVPTPIPIALNVDIPQGQTFAFYVTETGGAANIDYTNGTVVSALYVTDGNISVFEGTGKDYAFGADYAPRIPNMTIYYDCCPQPDTLVTPNSCSGAPDGSVEVTGQGVGPWVYEISDISGVIETSNAINGSYTFQGLIEGLYNVSATDADGCTAVVQVEVSTTDPLVLNTQVTDNLCLGGTSGEVSISISGGTAPFDVVWTDAFGSPLLIDVQTNGQSVLDGLAAGSYLVGAQDATGCSIIAPILISEPTTPLVITLSTTDLSCFESADGEIGVSYSGVSPFSFEVVDVIGNPVQQTNSQADHVFQGLDAGVYFITATDAQGCEATENTELFEPDQLEVETSMSPVLCFNGNEGVATIDLISGGTTPYGQTTWDDPMQQVGNTATGLSSGTYTATVVDANSCTAEAVFDFDNPPPLTLTPQYLTDTCGQGKGLAYLNVSLGTPPYNYLWKLDGSTAPTLDSLFQGMYEVVVTDANGCRDSTIVEVSDDLPYPFAAFDYRIGGENLLNNQVQFINNSVGTSQWTWFFGDGESSNQKDPKYHFDRAGDYLVQLLSSNGYCIDTAYQYVNIDPMLLVYVPNAFTPGRNGINDYFYPQGEGIELESYDMYIYDRWGKLVWATGNFSKKWDGTNMFSGKEVPVGTYVYLIKFREFADLDRHEYKGIVTVIRDQQLSALQFVFVLKTSTV